MFLTLPSSSPFPDSLHFGHVCSSVTCESAPHLYPNAHHNLTATITASLTSFPPYERALEVTLLDVRHSLIYSYRTDQTISTIHTHTFSIDPMRASRVHASSSSSTLAAAREHLLFELIEI
jgi:hypothetical protein